ncbi:hypothetical protein SteCoe_16962 [Stentor coeruleus]|uniref:Uncharacterized protein n=1 Tax=Stentor coeruleus TaxID=5963 RepID=A0A1R2C043_9CILI|nr:hypothetical protein SteCoe_16962 [Stentor coeruleus]
MQGEPSQTPSIIDSREELSKERKKSEELTSFLKSQERSYQKLIGELKTQIHAEQKKSSSLEASLQKIPYTMEQIIDLQGQLKSSELKQKALSDEFKHKIEELEIQHKEALSRTMTKELSAFKDYAISEITEKEKIVIEQKLIIDKLESSIRNLAQELDRNQAVSLTEKQKYKYEIEEFKEIVQDLQDEIMELRKKKDELKYCSRTQDEMVKNEENAEENRALKMNMESLKERLEKRSVDLVNAEKKINTLKESREELIRDIEKLESRIDQLVKENEDISKGLKNKEETIHILEEEINSNAEGINEKYKTELEASNIKCKRLEKKIKDIEQDYDNQIEDQMRLYTTLQIKANDLSRKVSYLEKEKESLHEKLKTAQDEIHDFDKKMQDYKKAVIKENDNKKEKLLEKIASLKNEREELKEKISELQEMSFSKQSLVETGCSLFEEFQQLPEGRYSRLSFKSPGNEDNKRVDGLISQLAEKDTMMKSLQSEKGNLEITLKEIMIENKTLQKELSISIRHSQKLSQELEMAKWELDNLRSDEDAKLDKGKILVLESEKELFKAEISKLETELMLTKDNWSELNNALSKDLLESQTATAQAKSELIRLREEYDSLIAISKEKANHNKKRSWFGRAN